MPICKSRCTKCVLLQKLQPPKLPVLIVESRPLSDTLFLGPMRVNPQIASHLVQLFLQGSQTWPTDTHTHTHTHTDRLHYAICTLGNRPHLAIAAMWPNIMRHHNISSQCINSHIPLGPLLMYHCYIQPLTHLAGFCGFVLSKWQRSMKLYSNLNIDGDVSMLTSSSNSAAAAATSIDCRRAKCCAINLQCTRKSVCPMSKRKQVTANLLVCLFI